MSHNKVIISQSQVQKRYRSRMSRDQELLFLTMLAGTGLVPEIEEKGQNTLTLASVEGDTLLEVLEQVWVGDRDLEEGRQHLNLLAEWLCAIYKKVFEQTGRAIALQDPHLRNFIISKSRNSLVGVDFEHWHYGIAEETPAMLLSFLDSYRGAQSRVAKELYSWFRKELILRLSLEEVVLSQIEKRCRCLLSLRRSTARWRKSSTAVILAGGRSLRMGRPKQDLSAGGYTFLERALDTLDSFDRVAVSVGKTVCDENIVPVWEDKLPECGPMGGLLTALSLAETPLVFLTACDMPDLNEVLILSLYEALSSEDECLVPVVNGQIHPLTGIYSTKLLPTVEKLIQAGDYKMRSLLNVAKTHYLPLGMEFSKPLSNINTPSEYNEWIASHTTIGRL